MVSNRFRIGMRRPAEARINPRSKLRLWPIFITLGSPTNATRISTISFRSSADKANRSITYAFADPPGTGDFPASSTNRFDPGYLGIPICTSLIFAARGSSPVVSKSKPHIPTLDASFTTARNPSRSVTISISPWSSHSDHGVFGATVSSLDSVNMDFGGLWVSDSSSSGKSDEIFP